jgi:hypothetical protein
VAEIEAVLPHDRWTLVGGLMAQLHAIDRGIDAIRPTNDVDIVLHVETTRGVAAQTASVLESLGYVLTPSIDERNNTAHRFKRGSSTVDLVASGPDVVDVLVAENAAPRVRELLRGRAMVAIEGGTQALRRTINARLEIVPGRTTTVSVPTAFGALILKSAAHQTDTRDRERHLQDSVVLLAAIEDRLLRVRRSPVPTGPVSNALQGTSPRRPANGSGYRLNPGPSRRRRCAP